MQRRSSQRLRASAQPVSGKRELADGLFADEKGPAHAPKPSRHSECIDHVALADVVTRTLTASGLHLALGALSAEYWLSRCTQLEFERVNAIPEAVREVHRLT